MSDEIIREQIVSGVQGRQSSLTQTATDLAAGAAEVGGEIAVGVAAEGLMETAGDAMLSVGESVLGAAGELLGGLADGI